MILIFHCSIVFSLRVGLVRTCRLLLAFQVIKLWFLGSVNEVTLALGVINLVDDSKLSRLSSVFGCGKHDKVLKSKLESLQRWNWKLTPVLYFFFDLVQSCSVPKLIEYWRLAMLLRETASLATAVLNATKARSDSKSSTAILVLQNMLHLFNVLRV